jgi:ABC-type multidrug transport system fused ATPase/permease subunit
VRVSGGQRQRIGIARALYRDPELLVLDEATSALDTITEQRITETVHHLHGRLTIVIVAHRLSTVRRCDQIVFLVDGRVRRIGTFDEVRDAEPEFAALVARSDLGAHEPSPG